MKYRQACSYCDTWLVGSIVNAGKKSPRRSQDINVVDSYMEVRCPACSKVWGYYKYSIESRRKYILFGSRYTYAVIPGNALDGKKYEISGTYSSVDMRREPGIGNVDVKATQETVYDIYMNAWEPGY